MCDSESIERPGALRRRPGRQRGVLVAMAVAIALVAGTQPAYADPPGRPGTPGGGTSRPPCIPDSGPSGVIGGVDGHVLPVTTTPGLVLPELTVESIPVDAMISPRPGESFEPIHLVEVRAAPSVKILRDGTIDPGQAVLGWTFTVMQRCPATDQLVRCEYSYHEMADGSIWEVRTRADGTLEERRYAIRCAGPGGFGAPGAPVDLGIRLLAAAKAELTPAQLRQPIQAAFGGYVAEAMGIPGLSVSDDVAAVGAAILLVLGAGQRFGGPCVAKFTSLVSFEMTAALALISAAAETSTARAVWGGVAVGAKVMATTYFLPLEAECTLQATAAGLTTPLALLYALLAATGFSIWAITLTAYLPVMTVWAIGEIWS